MQPTYRAFSPIAIVVAASLGVAGCGGALIKKLMPPSDYGKLVDFHDPALEKGSTTVVFENKGSGDSIWRSEHELSTSGLGKVHVRNIPYVNLPDKKGYGGYAPAFYEVTVNALSAKNLKWEVWSSNNQAQLHSGFGSTDIQFQKILGPFKAGEVVKLDYLKSEKPDSYGYRYEARKPLIVVYSPSEPGGRFSVELNKSMLAAE